MYLNRYKTKTEAENPTSVPLCGIINKNRTKNYNFIADSINAFVDFIRWYEKMHGKKPWQ